MRLLAPHSSLQWLRLRWPRELDAEQVTAALRALNGLSTPRRREVVVLQTVASGDGIHHHLAVPLPRAEAAMAQLRRAVRGIGVEAEESIPVVTIDAAWQLRLSTNLRPLDTHTEEAVGAALLAAMTGLGGNECVVLRWMLGPVRRPVAVPTNVTAGPSPYVPRLVTDVLNGLGNLDTEARRALAAKQQQPGWRAVCRVGVGARSRERRHQLLGGVAAALRTAQAPGVEVLLRPVAARRIGKLTVPLCWNTALNVDELAELTAWPVGDTDAPVQRIASRQLPPSRSVLSQGRVVAVSTYPGDERPLVLDLPDALSHLLVTGATGTGKSTAMLRLICDDISAGRSVVVVEPKGDLVRAVLERVPAERVEDVVLVDPAAEGAVVGLNPLAANGRPPELAADQLLAVFRQLYGSSWGPRIHDVIASGLLTLAQHPGTTLCHLPVLLTNDAYRRSVVARVHDDIGLGPFWAWFDRLSPPQRAEVLAPVMSRLRAFLLHPRLRAVLGQPRPRFELPDLFRRPTVLLVNLARGLLGPGAAGVLGSLTISQLWQATLGQAAVEPRRRRPVLFYVDEWQDFTAGVTDLAELLVAARGLGVGLTLANQHLAQLPPALRSAVMANARSHVVMQTAHEDAAVIVRGQTRLQAEDVTGLQAHECYVRLLAGGSVMPWASARTLPPPPPCSDPETVRQRSAERWGVPREEVEAELAGLHRPTAPAVPIGSRRREGDRR